ncbi:MAG TPA: hypothetical protein PKD85_05795 [Saprospiraceae bacterium]|nr:hypothetical protein [Saprospiraceae bacterium]
MQIAHVLHKFYLSPIPGSLPNKAVDESDICTLKKTNIKNTKAILTIKNKSYEQNIKVKDMCLEFWGLYNQDIKIEKTIFINTYTGEINICNPEIAKFCKIHKLSYHLNFGRTISIRMPSLNWTPYNHRYFKDIRYGSFKNELLAFLLVCKRIHFLNKDMQRNIINEICILHQNELKSGPYLRISNNLAYTVTHNSASALFWYERLKEI